MFGRRAEVVQSPGSPADGDDASIENELRALIAEVEATALAVYRRYGLPDRPGQYARDPRAKAWNWLAESLRPEEKWARLESHPTGTGWRYGDLIRVGQEADAVEARMASGVLAACEGLKARIESGRTPTFQDLADALRLGEAWRRMAEVPPPPKAPRRRKT